MLWKWFDVALWKRSLFKRLAVVDLPDLSGAWNARAASVLDGVQQLTLGRAHIHQTWSRLSLSILWEHSRSQSVSGLLQRAASGRFELVYQYLNEPDVLAVATMHIHRGTAWLELDASHRELSGEYFSGRGRQQIGKLVLSREARISFD